MCQSIIIKNKEVMVVITLSKIAKEAHVSVSTASKAFSGSSEVNEETRQLVFEVAKRYGCFKKFFNAKYSKYVVAIICPEFSSIHYTNYLSCLSRYLEQENCEICVAESAFSAKREMELVDYYYKHADVDAIVVIEPHNKISGYHEVPVLLIGPINKDNDCATLFCDVDSALVESIDYLIGKKVTAIGFIGEALTSRKLKYFQRILADKGLNCNEAHIQTAQQRFEAGGYEAMEKILTATPLPRAVICAYDNMAIGAIRCINDHGLRVPEDIAILGMDNIPQAPYLVPPLASIDSKTDFLCRLAVDTVIDQINGKEVPLKQSISSTLQIRESFEIK